MRSIINIFLLLALILASCNKYDIQPEQAEGFIKFYSSTLTESALDVKETSDGGYVAIGTTTNDATGLRDLYLLKTDKYGNEESWSPVTIGGDYDDVGTSIQVVSDGYVILGYSKKTDSTDYDMYLVKTDLQGNVQWEQWEDDGGDERGTNLQVTSAGEYLAAGIRLNPGTGNYDLKIVRFNTSGDVVKDRLLGDAIASLSSAYIIETSDYFVTCNTVQYQGKDEIWIIPVFKDSHFQSEVVTLRASGDLSGNCIQELSDGNLLVSGTIVNASTGLSDIYLNKLSASFVQDAGWAPYKTFTEGGGDQASLTGNSVRIINDNSYAIVGTRTETGNDDIILLHTDAGGNEVSRRIFGDDGFQQGISLEVTGFDGGLIVVGNNGSEDNSMITLLKTDAAGKL